MVSQIKIPIPAPAPMIGLIEQAMMRKRAQELLKRQNLFKNILALEGELGPLPSPAGGYSTEISITVEDPDHPGRFVNIPTLVSGQVRIEELLKTLKPDEEQIRIAVARAKERVRQGQFLPSFRSIEDAEKAARKRSEEK